MTFARESWPFVSPFLAAAVVAAVLGHLLWAAGLATLGLLVLMFFRNPRRRYEGPGSTVLAPADGLVTRVDEVEDSAVAPGRLRRVVTFLSVFDVHVQRLPASGEVVVSSLRPGRKVAAFRHDAGEVNEGHLSVLRLPDGALIGIRQIAGLFARRVVCHLRPGERRTRGELMGLIKFGSRVDLIVPPGYRILVKPGDRVRNGETPMAEPGEAA